MYRHSTVILPRSSFFFLNDTATTEIYTLSLHDALPISHHNQRLYLMFAQVRYALLQSLVFLCRVGPRGTQEDRKSTRLNSSHTVISYAVFCLKKKKENELHR